MVKETKKTVIIIQARMNSNRLPGKVLLSLPFGTENTQLKQVIRRALQVGFKDLVVVATSVNPENDPLASAGISAGADIFRGDENNVLKRFYDAAVKFGADTIVRLTADNPFIDPLYIDNAIAFHDSENNEYTVTAGLPLGTNIEIFSMDALRRAYENAQLEQEREHVTPYIKNHPEWFKTSVLNIHHFEGYNSIRLTVDNESDYALACMIYDSLYHENAMFGLKDIVELIKKKPWIAYINKENIQKKVFKDRIEELKEGVQLMNHFDMPFASSVLTEKLKEIG